MQSGADKIKYPWEIRERAELLRYLAVVRRYCVNPPRNLLFQAKRKENDSP